jgi:hypothetical protein
MVLSCTINGGILQWQSLLYTLNVINKKSPIVDKWGFYATCAFRMVFPFVMLKKFFPGIGNIFKFRFFLPLKIWSF